MQLCNVIGNSVVTSSIQFSMKLLAEEGGGPYLLPVLKHKSGDVRTVVRRISLFHWIELDAVFG